MERRRVSTLKLDSYNRFVPAEECLHWACAVRATGKKGKGLFAMEDIPKGVVFCVDGGVVYDKPCHNYAVANCGVLVAEGKFLYPRDVKNPPPLAYLNHSCDANLGRIGGLVYVTKKAIAAGEEATIDYSPLVAGLDWWRLECTCGAKACRKIISGNDWQDKRLAKRLWIEWLPHIQKKIAACSR